MLVRTIAVGVTVLIAAGPATAQQRGTLEFGAFGSHTAFDSNLGLTNSWGGGGRIGAFIFPRLSAEFEGGVTDAGRTLGRRNVNVGVLSARLAGTPLKLGRLSVLLGAGVDYTDAQFLDSYGVHGLVGAKLAFSESFALRVDGIQSYMANDERTNTSVHAGFSIYRHPVGRTTTVFRTVEAPPLAQRSDSVSAYEIGRLRGVAANYEALRDSLAMPAYPEYVPASSREALATMQQMIYFANDNSGLSDSARETLSAKLAVFRANPAMRIVIVGFASQPGTETYNMALGLRRAEAAKAYLVSQGVDPIRIEIATRGEGQLMVEGPGEAADAANRRGQFRLQIADPYLTRPKN